MKKENLPTIQDHLITLFYFIDSPDNISNINHQLLNEITPNKLATETQSPLWEKHSYNISVDLSKNISQLFHAKNNKIINTWKLTEAAKKHINGTKEGSLTLILSNSAKQRLQIDTADNNPTLHIENILYHQFKTNFGVASIELIVKEKNLSSSLLNEILYSLTRFNKISWQAQKSTQKPTKTRMGKLLRQLLKQQQSSKIARVYSHTYIQLDNSATEAELDRYLVKLAKHYNDAYHLKDDTQQQAFIKNYDNIQHCYAQEGAATAVLIDNNSPEILTDYKNKIIKPVHIPLHLLAYHLEQTLQHYAMNSTLWITHDKQYDHNIQQLKDIQNNLLNLNLNFYFPIVSSISTHNEIQNHLNKTKQLDQQHHKLTANIHTIQQIIDENISHDNTERNIKYCKIAALGVAAAGYLTSFSIIKEGIEAAGEMHLLKTQAPHIAEILHHYTGLISLGGSLLILLIVYILARRHCPYASGGHAHTSSHQALHAIHSRHPLHKKHK